MADDLLQQIIKDGKIKDAEEFVEYYETHSLDDVAKDFKADKYKLRGLYLTLAPRNEVIQVMAERMAKFESQLASSWAVTSRDDYEKKMKEGLYRDTLISVWKTLGASLGIISIIGVVLLKQFAGEIVEGKVKDQVSQVQDSVKKSLDDVRKEGDQRFAWMQSHFLGKNAFSIAQVLDLNLTIKNRLLAYQLQSAFSNQLDATSLDKNQAAAFWELGTIYYWVYRHKPDLLNVDIPPNLYNLDEGINYFLQAANKYKPDEVTKGWRFQAYARATVLYNAKGDITNREKYKKMATADFENVYPKTKDLIKLRERMDTLDQPTATPPGAGKR